jgi:putative FmdB family regulatory protein
MPTYEYQCPNGHRFEVVQKMSDDPITACTDCGEPAERVISGGSGFLFRGEGFYITDYRSEDYKKKASAETGDSPAAASEPKSKGESTTGSSSEGSSPVQDTKPSSDG